MAMAVFLTQTLLLTNGRKSYLVKEQNDLRLQPPVLTASGYDCSKLLFENDDDTAYLQYDIDHEFGWLWYQEILEYQRYRVRLELYSQQMLKIHPVFDVPRLYFNEQEFQVDQFKA